jgi:hypothetical protein
VGLSVKRTLMKLSAVAAVGVAGVLAAPVSAYAAAPSSVHPDVSVCYPGVVWGRGGGAAATCYGGGYFRVTVLCGPSPTYANWRSWGPWEWADGEDMSSAWCPASYYLIDWNIQTT